MTVDLAQFHDAFFEESFEALDTMEAALLKLDVGAPEPELINTIFRVAHSIKGGSATFGFADIASFTHSLETLLDELRSATMPVTAAVCDLLLRSVDIMRAMLRAVQAKQPIDAQRVSDLQFDLEVAIANKSRKEATPHAGAGSPGAAAANSATAPASAAAPTGHATGAAANAPRWHIRFRPFRELLARGNDPLRIVRELAELGELTTRLDAQMLPPFAALNPQDCHLAWSLDLSAEVPEAAIRQVFEWAEGDCDLNIERLPGGHEGGAPPPADSAPPAPAPTPTSSEPARQRAETAIKPEAAVSGLGDSGSIRVSVEKIDELMNTVGELVITQAMLSQLGAHFDGPDAEQLRNGLAQLERNMRELQEGVMRVRMLPISFVFSRFPRMVRDLAQRLGKQIELKLSGEQTELDKTVLEKIGDPLVHLVRNCIDHGIESPEARAAAGKSATGTVHLDAYHRGGNIAVEVHDDGGGLNKERILAKARARGLLGANDPLTDAEIYELIFLPGFSTVDKTTDVSGRGVGMDVVRRNVKELGGKVEVMSEPGRGSRFTITLPLTLAIVDGQLVAVGSETYIVPLISIVESMQLKANGITRLSGRTEVLSFRGEYLPIIRLHDLFGVEPRSRALHEGLVVVAEGDGRRIGLFVDDLLGQQQVVIKSLETNYGHIAGVSGATILGDGSVALILDVPGLIRAASMRAAA
jgi:two-component system, chemotaxis family, sensor kinase CheA